MGITETLTPVASSIAVACPVVTVCPPPPGALVIKTILVGGFHPGAGQGSAFETGVGAAVAVADGFGAAVEAVGAIAVDSVAVLGTGADWQATANVRARTRRMEMNRSR